MLASVGYRVEQNPAWQPGDAHDPAKNPDLRVGGRVFDVYAPFTADLDTIRDAMSRKARGQAARIVVNLADSLATTEQINGVLTRKPVAQLREVLVIDRAGRVSRLFPDPTGIT